MRAYVVVLAAFSFLLAPVARLVSVEAYAASSAAFEKCKTDLTPHLSALNVPGLAAAIVKNGRIVCTGTAGMANIEEGRPVTPDTLFLVASVSKTVTATALMQLYEEGRFHLDDNINDYLPFRVSVPAAPDAPITFHQLLTHTGSIDDNDKYTNCPGWCQYGSPISEFVTRGSDSPISLADLMRGYLVSGGAYYDEQGSFEGEPPGSKADYSNMGIVLVGYLVEVISGVPFDEFCRERIFAPLGMKTTAWRLSDIDPSILAMPYDQTPDGKFVPFGQYGEPDYPDGMLRTSATELARFLIAYMNGGILDGHRILKPETVKAMLSSQTPLEPAQGLVWFEDSWGNRTVWGHDGSDNGAEADMWFDPATGEGVVLLSNGIWEDQGELMVALFREADRY
jgi:CubicO group peptidase (beta-lactamase class C family)